MQHAGSAIPAVTFLQHRPCSTVPAVTTLQCHPCSAILAVTSLQCFTRRAVPEVLWCSPGREEHRGTEGGARTAQLVQFCVGIYKDGATICVSPRKDGAAAFACTARTIPNIAKL